MPSEKAKGVANIAWVWGTGGQTFQWTNVSNLSTLEKWAKSTSINPFDDIEQWVETTSKKMTMVCYELVLFAAVHAGVLDRKSLKALYEKGGGWEARLNGDLFGRTKEYNVNLHSPVPEQGDIVFFDGSHHVAIATGETTLQGLPQIASFWGLTPIPTVQGDMWAPAPVELTTMEAMAAFIKQSAPQFESRKVYDVKVTFCPPPW